MFEPACKLGGVIETTGAGDTFCACVLNFVLDQTVPDFPAREGLIRFFEGLAILAVLVLRMMIVRRQKLKPQPAG